MHAQTDRQRENIMPPVPSIMGMSEVVMLDMKGHMVVLGTALGTLMVPGYWSLQMG